MLVYHIIGVSIGQGPGDESDITFLENPLLLELF